MEKLERSTKEYGSACCACTVTFRDEDYRVVNWIMTNGKRTTLSHKLLETDIHFDGFIEFENAEDCFNQYEYSEILEIMNQYYNTGHQEGVMQKQREFQSVLGLKLS